jgi:aspartyl-tRNA synthetase
VVEIEGTVKARPGKTANKDIATGSIELQATKIKILAESASLPFAFMGKDLNLTLPTLLDFRPLTIRNPEIKNIFKAGEMVVESFRKTLKSLDFRGERMFFILIITNTTPI